MVNKFKRRIETIKSKWGTGGGGQGKVKKGGYSKCVQVRTMGGGGLENQIFSAYVLNGWPVLLCPINF